jgi:hypothetical protein
MAEWRRAGAEPQEAEKWVNESPAMSHSSM